MNKQRAFAFLAFGEKHFSGAFSAEGKVLFYGNSKVEIFYESEFIFRLKLRILPGAVT